MNGLLCSLHGVLNERVLFASVIIIILLFVQLALRSCSVTKHRWIELSYEIILRILLCNKREAKKNITREETEKRPRICMLLLYI